VLLLCAAGLLLGPQAARAQEFGRNRVAWQNYDWKVMHTPHYNVHFYPIEEEHATDAARMAERWYSRLGRAFQHTLTETKPILLYADAPAFYGNNVTPGLGQGVGGVTEPIHTRLIMPFTGVYKDDDHVLGHEMVHVYQYDIAEGKSGAQSVNGTGGGLAAMNRLPSWMIEGMAEYLSLGREDPLTALWMRDAALTGHLPTVDQLNSGDPHFFPYRYGEALWAYIGGKWGDRAVTEIYRFSLREGPEAALRRVLGVTPAQLSQEWLTAVRSAYLPLVEGRTRPGDAGHLIIGKNKPEDMNVGPVVSPDGKYVAFFSARSLFSIDLYLADAQTGKIVKKLASPFNNSHIDDISFVASSGSFSPDASEFAYVVYARGKNQLAILDVSSGSTRRYIDVSKVGEITNPAWSPNGGQIAFSGNKGGISDLYVVNVASGAVRQLTNDRYADLHPAWSPDGKSLAWSTDREQGTDFGNLTYAPLHVAVMDMNTRQTRLLPGVTDAQEINPQFSPDGASVYFLSNREGFSDIYRQVLATGEIEQVTRLATGVSGITALSPSISVARQTGRLVFSVFQNGGYNLYYLEAAQAVGTTVPAAPAPSVAGILPPTAATSTSLVVAYLHDPTTGLPPATDARYAVTVYRPSLELDYVGQPTMGVGTTGYGTAIGGGASAYFSDLLGNRTLGVAVQANGTVQDIGGEVFYLNTGHRWNWATLVAHIPYLTGFTDVQPNNDGTFFINQHLIRVFLDQAFLDLQFPFNQTSRFEVTGGYLHQGYSSTLYQYQTDQFGNVLGFSQQKDTLFQGTGLLNGFHMFSTAAELVGDWTFFGFTSPIAGGRYHLEVGPTVGSMNFVSTLLDYRQYAFKNPVTFAVRALTTGRFGSGARDQRMTPLFVGYPTLVRGYEAGNFNPNECTAVTNSNDCPEFSRLLGSSIAVANAEIRLPLFGIPGYGLLNFPFLPTEIAPFVDGGLAWGPVDNYNACPIANPGCGLNYQSPTLQFVRNTTARVPVFSAGLSARFNVLGYLVAEVYYAYPFQRPLRGAHFGFNISPGW
jgi:Tol biopolymer transport system component